MNIVEIIDVVSSFGMLVVTTIGIILSNRKSKSNGKSYISSQKNSIKGNSNTLNCINIDNSINVEYNQHIHNGDNYYVPPDFLPKNKDSGNSIVWFVFTIFFSLIFLELRIFVFTLLVLILASRVLREIYRKDKSHILGKLVSLSLVCISLIFYWAPFNSGMNYPEDLLTFVFNNQQSNASIIQILPLICLAVSQLVGILFMFFLLAAPFLDNLFKKLKHRFNIKMQWHFEQKIGVTVIFAFLSVFFSSGAICFIFLLQ